MTANFHFDEIARIYDKRRMDNIDLHKKRIAEVYENVPGFKELDSSISNISGSQLASIISGDRQALASIKNSLNNTELEKKALLTQYGYDSTYLDPIYTCPDCEDTGYINNMRCHCYKKEFLSILYQYSNLEQVIGKENFSNFNIEYYPDDYICSSNNMTPRDNIKKVLNTCKNFIDNFDACSDNLLLYGHSGVGKTFISNCIAKEILDRGYSVIYLTSYQFFDILETKVFHSDEMDDISSGILSMLNSSDLLIIDDLGTEMVNKFTEVQLFKCIQDRLLNNRSTIISTNLSFDDISNNYSERIFSRLTGYYTLVKITGEDIRIKKALQSKQ